MKKQLTFLALLALLFAACSQQQARRPVSRSSGTFMRESVARNQKLIAGEEARIDSIIKFDKAHHYTATPKGYWYYHVEKNATDTLRPHKGMVAYFDYEIQDLQGNVLYSQVELRPQTYVVDKQNILMGLRDGIKQMRKNETVVFLFPSHLGFGYRGDTKRIGPNTPLIVTVTLNDIQPESKTTLD